MRSFFLLVPILTSGALTAAAEAQSPMPPELAKRLEDEKTARRECKIEICKAFDLPGSGAAVSCNITKTYLRDEVTARIVGGSYIWSYGHMKCSFKVSLDRTELQKARKPEASSAKFSEHAVTCDVEDKDSSKGVAFQVKSSFSPVVTFDKGQATAVALQDLKTEGSSAASAAVSSLMALDKLSGFVSKVASKELNEFMFEKCKGDGVTIEPLK